MTRDERSALFRSISIVVKRYVSNSIESVSTRLDEWIDEFNDRLGKIPAGKDGRDGIDGKDGTPGVNGKDGLDGKNGSDGANGRDGVDGKDGALGIAGKDGVPGLDGKDGKDGSDGKDGRPGERGLTGEKGDKGDIGERGPIGLTGPEGIRGEKGERGEKGASGERGIVGERGEKGMDGKDGRDGRDGKDGLHGRDALEIDILPCLDLAKTYPRGTFASHFGGTVRAYRDNANPQNPSDWQIVANGVASESYSIADDHRTFTRTITMTSGEVIERLFSLPVMIYRGVYKAGNTYQRGDCVSSYQGSVWHCNAESTSVAPATPNNKDWQLMVRAGKDGKDFNPPKPEDLGPIKLK